MDIVHSRIYYYDTCYMLCNSKGLIFGDIKLDDDGALRLHYSLSIMCVWRMSSFSLNQ